MLPRQRLILRVGLLLTLICLTESASARPEHGDNHKQQLAKGSPKLSHAIRSSSDHHSRTEHHHHPKQKSDKPRKQTHANPNMLPLSKDSDEDSSPKAKKQKMTKGEKSSLLLVNVMFRHGDRAPEPAELTAFPNYEHVNDTWFPVGAGHLTNGGKQRLFKLGKTMRARYGKFLGELYSTNLAATFSTDIARTKASALMFNAGLWPPNHNQKWSEDEGIADLWQPITYVTDPKLNAAMNVFLVSPCYHQEFTKVINRPEFQQRLFPREKLWNYLSENIGTKVEHPIQVWMLQSLFRAAEAMGKEKPQWVQDVWDEMQDVAKVTFDAMFFNDDLKRMAIGPVFKKIMDDCKEKTEEETETRERKLFVYSGHDTTVAPLFAALGGPDGFIDEEGNPLKTIVPSFGSAVVLELHRLKDGEHAVKVLYNEGSADASFKPLRISGFGEYCPLDKYLDLTKHVAVEDQGLESCKRDKNYRTMLDYLNPSHIPGYTILKKT